MVRSAASLVALATLAACAGRPVAVTHVLPPPVPVAAPAPAMPAGGFPGMVIPARLADGSYPTPGHPAPGRTLTADAATWHLRAALNVAALACREDAGALVGGYNAMLTARRVALAGAETRYAAEWKATGAADWRDGYDDAMTRLYNFYGQAFARPAFCAAAAGVLAEMATLPDAELAGFASRRIGDLDRPFTDFFAAYDAWRGGVALPVIAVAAAPSPRPPVAVAVAVAAAAPPPPAPVQVAEAAPAAKPRLQIDPALFRMP